MEQAKTFRWDPFDATKVRLHTNPTYRHCGSILYGCNFLVEQLWPRCEVPYIPVGKIVLNENPINFFANVEQIAFAPDHLIPGIEPSPDRMLQVST